MSKLGRIFQYHWSSDMKCIILLSNIIISLSKEVNNTVTGYALGLSILGFNFAIKLGKNRKGILKSHGIS